MRDRKRRVRTVVRDHSDVTGEPSFEVCAVNKTGDDIGCVHVALANYDPDDPDYYLQVEWAWVDMHQQRRGIATSLYQRAAVEACKRGAPLQSDILRSPAADSFWAKQARKGRAELRSRWNSQWQRDAEFYRLRCPPPKTLARGKL